ncbi:hypothetical protein AKG39_16675 [Acetobacterium bakii]|uniref:TnpV protein n=1 Tax=Acetobacterium bakii TaxID=52689 RepID=A0A0L6TX15_9FIRM|nr:hypothetical protein AKG39_16675 [Acetobacterium bakii]
MESENHLDEEYQERNFKLLTQTRRGVGMYEELRYNYLKENKQELFSELFFQGKLNEHLAAVEQSARNRLDQIIRCLLVKHPAPDKNAKPLSWAQHMNKMTAAAREIVIQELIYN